MTQFQTFPSDALAVAPDRCADRTRLHGVDAARALFLLMGIPFHLLTVGVRSAPNTNLMVHEPISALFFAFNTSFRMFAFFIIAGYFSAMMLQRKGHDTWLRDRLRRLFVPFVSGLLIYGSLNYWLQLQFGGDPLGLFKLPIVLGHLWFLIVLLLYVGLLYICPANLLVRARSLDIATALQLRGRPMVVLMAVLILYGAFGSALFMALDKVGSSGVSSVIFEKFIWRLPAFVLGVMVFQANIGHIFFRLPRLSAVVMAGIGSLLLVASDPVTLRGLGLGTDRPFVLLVFRNLLEIPIALLLSCVVIGGLSALLKSPNRIVTWAVNSAMGIYLSHFTFAWLYVGAIHPALGLRSTLSWVVGTVLVTGASSLLHVALTQVPVLDRALNGAK